MPLIIASHWQTDPDRITMLARLFSFVSSQGDRPVLWKLNDQFVDAIEKCLRSIRSGQPFTLTHWMEIPVDFTSAAPALIGERQLYPLGIVGPVN